MGLWTVGRELTFVREQNLPEELAQPFCQRNDELAASMDGSWKVCSLMPMMEQEQIYAATHIQGLGPEELAQPHHGHLVAYFACGVIRMMHQ